ncbi:MAG: metallophosphoesterase family protein [Bacteroidales bacterium]|nr:metallophosphoesterase family protein [Bacteroidales bacterium]MBQ5602891.1 metallophosphoesterase family protein [Bacteroidales bacterium]
MMYIGLISDTHGVFSKEFRDFLEPVDQIWHAGDFGGGMELAKEIAAFKPLLGVAGNCDNYNLRYDHPLYRFFECEGMKVLMTHVGGYPGKYDARARQLIDELKPDIFVCGHSHILKVVRDQKRDMLVINPGAAGIQGFHLVRTALRFHIENGRIDRMEVFELDRESFVK